MTHLTSLERFELGFEHLSDDNPRVLGQIARRRREADIKKLQKRVMSPLVVNVIATILR